jgi:4-hydroxythreonine-4-phosphate dehydrogenase
MKPLLAITMGDPTGVGPEIIVKACSAAAVHDVCRPVVLGHPEIMRRAAQLVGSPAEVVIVKRLDDCQPSPRQLACLPCCSDDVLQSPVGKVDGRGGEAAYQAIRYASELAQRHAVDGMVTAPLSKAALVAAGHHYPGHTELLADLCGVSQVAMMLYLAPQPALGQQRGLGVAHVTLHVAMRDIFALLTVPRILRTAELAHTITWALLVAEGQERLPKIGVCALNPHAGEVGLFGEEERQVISPAVEQGRAAGLDLHGPYPADTLLARAAAGEFDAVVAMYHDQGHIALKLLTMHRAVNITLGLPVIRTSVAHGTAYDRAWKGTAQCDSMIAAIEAAAKLVQCRESLNWDGPCLT